MPGDLRRPQPAAREGKRARSRARRALPLAATRRPRWRGAAEHGGGAAPGRRGDTPALRGRRVREEGARLVRAGGRG
eukprot:2459735-Pleurochrysis_carterae.AAC.1